MYYDMLLYSYTIFGIFVLSVILIVVIVQQILSRTFQRFYHTTKINFAAEKSLLATLRKKTGYTFANCKKALEMHNNDINKAESWLNEQAQSMGWSKATKLEGRQTSQGLIGVSVHHTSGVMVEVNCETDFVARNKEFENMVEVAADACLNYIKTSPESGDLVTKICLDSEQLKNLKTKDGKSLADKLALMIGTVGENASLKRALGFKVKENISLAAYAHPSGKEQNNVILGRLGGLVALRSIDRKNTDLSDIGKRLCQHIVGMNPKQIGNVKDDRSDNKEDETSLVHQEYLLDDNLTVGEVLSEENVEVIEFRRFECGENLKAVGDQPLEYVETCQ